MKKGDLILVPFPFTNLSASKKRPALILRANDLDITVAFITSKVKWQESGDVILSPSIENGLKKPSLIRLSKLATLDRTLAIGKLGSIDDLTITKVNKSLKLLLELE